MVPASPLPTREQSRTDTPCAVRQEMGLLPVPPGAGAISDTADAPASFLLLIFSFSHSLLS